MAAAWDGTGIDGWLPERLAAELEIVEAERRMYNAWWGSFSEWIVGVNRAVTAGRTPDPHAVWSQVPAWADLMDELVAGPVTDVVGKGFTDLFGDGYAFDARPSVTSFLAQVQNRMVRTPDEVFDAVTSTIARGAAAGDDLATVADRVDQVLSASGTQRWRGRAVTVARTETQSALNFGRYDSFTAASEVLDQPMDLMWLSTVDHRTRESHVHADGQRVPNPGGLFMVGGWPMQYPGDPNAPASERVNCRCTTLLLKPGEVVDMTGRGGQDPDEVWAQYREAETAGAKPEMSAEEKLHALDKKTPTGARQLGGGQMGDVRLLTHDDGSKVVEKIYGRRLNESAAELRREMDAERLAPKVLDAFGVRTPAVVSTGKGRLLMEYLDGEIGAELRSQEETFASLDGRRMGFADAVMANYDRNNGNWLLMPGKRLAGIDHGEAFHPVSSWGDLYSDFTAYIVTSDTAGNWTVQDDIEFDPVELASIRAKLMTLRPEFTALGRGGWFDDMMKRFDEIAKHLK